MLTTELVSIIGGNVRCYRNDLQLTQLELAVKSKLSKAYIAQIETGKKTPSLEAITMLAEALEICPYQLFLDDEVPDENEEMIDHARKIADTLKSTIDKAISKYLKQNSKHRK